MRLAMLTFAHSLFRARGLGRLVASRRLASARPSANWQEIEPLKVEVAVGKPVDTSAWGRLGLGEDVSKALLALELTEPSEIQTKAIPAICDGQDILYAA